LDFYIHTHHPFFVFRFDFNVRNDDFQSSTLILVMLLLLTSLDGYTQADPLKTIDRDHGTCGHFEIILMAPANWFPASSERQSITNGLGAVFQ